MLTRSLRTNRRSPRARTAPHRAGLTRPRRAPQESLEGRLDSLKGKSVAQAETGHGAGMAFADTCTFVSDGLASIVVAGTPHADVLDEADDGLSEKQARSPGSDICCSAPTFRQLSAQHSTA